MSDPHAPEALYKDYWTGADEERSKRRYYERLYAHVRHRLAPAPELRILDVAGGNGHLMRYLGIPKADIIDISESGLEAAKKSGFGAVRGNVEERFPVPDASYDAAFCFEVLEHLHSPNRTLVEVNRALKSGGVLYVGQPNMPADGVYHVRRYYLKDLLDDLDKAGFRAEWVDYVPAYSMRDSIVSDIRKNRSWIRKAIQCVNLALSWLPWAARYRLAHWIPDRFALILIVKAVKKPS